MLESLFILMCVQAPIPHYGQYEPACEKALEATSSQMGVTAFYNDARSAIEAKIKEKTNKSIITTVGTAYALGVKKEVRIQTRIASPIVDTISINGTKDRMQMGLTWAF